VLAAGECQAGPAAMGSMSGKIRILELRSFEVVHPGCFEFFGDITLVQSMQQSKRRVYCFVFLDH
jgi:hypothetical protein